MATQKIVKKSLFDSVADLVIKNNQKITVLLGVALVCAVLFMGNNLWVAQKNKSAQGYFGILVMEYNQALNDKNADWDALRAKFEKGFVDHSGSSLVPYYKSYVVNILLQQNKADEAAALLDVIESDAQSSSMTLLYAIERALIDLDSGDIERQKKGEQALRVLADNTMNQFADMAQFYLGRYYWANDQIVQAREVWEKLVDEQAHEKIAPSPWAQQVKEYVSIKIV
jgi:hypothetical protein